MIIVIEIMVLTWNIMKEYLCDIIPMMIKWSVEMNICILKILFYVSEFYKCFSFSSKVSWDHVQIFWRLFYFEKMFVKLVNIIEWNIVCLLSQQWCIDCKNNEKEGWMPYYENYIYEKIL
jgi:hypothetical protein